MGRPYKDSSALPMRQRIEDAFWQLVSDVPIDRITVNELTHRAGCNRSTFYYYYTDVYDLLDRVIDNSLPRELPAFLFGQFLNSDTNVALFTGLVQDSHASIDKLCILLASASSALVTRKVRKALFELWHELLTAQGAHITADARIVLEFAIGGILGLMAYRAESGMSVSVADVVRVVSPELPTALASTLRCAMATQ